MHLIQRIIFSVPRSNPRWGSAEKRVGMRSRLATLALGLLLVMPIAWAQSSSVGAPTAASPMRVGIVNLQLAITSTAEGKKAAADLQSQFASRQIELQNLQKQIDDIRTSLQ